MVIFRILFRIIIVHCLKVFRKKNFCVCKIKMKPVAGGQIVAVRFTCNIIFADIIKKFFLCCVLQSLFVNRFIRKPYIFSAHYTVFQRTQIILRISARIFLESVSCGLKSHFGNFISVFEKPLLEVFIFCDKVQSLFAPHSFYTQFHKHFANRIFLVKSNVINRINTIPSLIRTILQ